MAYDTYQVRDFSAWRIYLIDGTRQNTGILQLPVPVSIVSIYLSVGAASFHVFDTIQAGGADRDGTGIVRSETIGSTYMAPTGVTGSNRSAFGEKVAIECSVWGACCCDGNASCVQLLVGAVSSLERKRPEEEPMTKIYILLRNPQATSTS